MRLGTRENISPTTLYVSGFKDTLKARDLAYDFERIGPLIRCETFPARSGGKCFGFVEYRDLRDAAVAFEQLQGAVVDGACIRLEYARARPRFGEVPRHEVLKRQSERARHGAFDRPRYDEEYSKPRYDRQSRQESRVVSRAYDDRVLKQRTSRPRSHSPRRSDPPVWQGELSNIHFDRARIGHHEQNADQASSRPGQSTWHEASPQSDIHPDRARLTEHGWQYSKPPADYSAEKSQRRASSSNAKTQPVATRRIVIDASETTYQKQDENVDSWDARPFVPKSSSNWM